MAGHSGFNKEFLKKVGLIKKNLRENQKDRTRSETPSDKHGALRLCQQKQVADSSECREKYFLPSPKSVFSQSLKSGAIFLWKIDSFMSNTLITERLV